MHFITFKKCLITSYKIAPKETQTKFNRFKTKLQSSIIVH
ncbi:hypothetical protein LOK49_Contig268G00002 [Camellia lanceoleosa]|nr:hypothetical protein LOK49_Contig268G00002 [Camellia lanceoleosa]